MAYRSAITLYCEAHCVAGHGVRMVVAEKDINITTAVTTRAGRSEDLLSLNPYDEVLTLVDRDVALYEPQIMLEYLDERFPHPPLMPIDPMGRAVNRQVRIRLERELIPLMKSLQSGGSKGDAAGVVLRDHITALAPGFAPGAYLLSPEFSLADCVLAPMLWQLRQMGIELPAAAKSVRQYSERVFARPSFRLRLEPQSAARSR